MDHKTKLDLAIINLVAEYESGISGGKITYLDEKQYFKLIAYYENECLFEKALGVLEKALLQFQFRSEFYIAKARLLLNIDQLDQAEKYLDKAEAVAPYEMEIKILRAKLWAEKSRNVEALNLLDELKVGCMDSDLADIYITESYIFEKMKDFDSMFLSLSDALKINPSNTEALDRIWLSAELSRSYLKSINIHKRILDKDPYNYLAWYNLGHAYSCIGEYEDAIDSLEYSFIINTDFKNGYLDCADLCFQLKKYKKSLEYYTDADSLFGPDAELNLFIAECQLKLGNIQAAKSRLFEALRLDRYNDELYYNLALCYSADGLWYRAVNAFHKAISIEDNREEYYLGLAKAYVAVDNDEKAIINFKKATLTAPEQSEFWVAFSSYLMKKGMHLEALTILDEAEDHTYSAELLFCRAACNIFMNRRKEGLLVLEEALLENYFSLDVFYNLNPEFTIDNELQALIRYYNTELNIT